jgi:hypothetical protein
VTNPRCESDVPPNKGMELSKPQYLVGGWPTRLGIIESGFAAHAQCSADSNESTTAQ